jgi:hypothetical protein
MTEPEFATTITDSLMGLALDADEVAAVVILMRDGGVWSRQGEDVATGSVVLRLRELADEMEEA